uniref:Uncharacterized protein n=1 Tax=Romanomermis culicivorax TaxID=13658 RepID=A0A915JHK0_ROMCU
MIANDDYYQTDAKRPSEVRYIADTQSDESYMPLVPANISCMRNKASNAKKTRKKWLEQF